MAAVVVDDSDPRIQYSGSWFTSGGPQEYRSSTHGTRESGASATFKFNGSSIVVYGTLSNSGLYKEGPISTYSIDGTNPVSFHAKQEATVQYRQRFFVLSDLKDGEHSLVITSTITGPFFWIDYIEVTPSVSASELDDEALPANPSPSPELPPTPPPPPPGGRTDSFTPIAPSPPTPTIMTPETTPAATTLIAGQTITTTSDEHTSTYTPAANMIQTLDRASTTTLSSISAESSSTSIPIVTQGLTVPAGAVAGGSIGGVVALVILLFVCFILWRRKRRNVETLPTTNRRFTARSSFWSPTQPIGVLSEVPPVPPLVGTHVAEPLSSPVTNSGHFPGYGYGYTVRGGTSAEKQALHASTSYDTSNDQCDPTPSEVSSQRGLIVYPSGQFSAHSRASPSRSVVIPSSGRHHSGDLFQNIAPTSYGPGSLYQRDPGDTPPAYQSTFMHQR